MKKAIDVHAHILPQGFVDLIKRDKRFLADFVEKDDGTKFIKFNGGFIHPYNPAAVDPQVRLEHMDNTNIKYQALSVSPRLFYYYAPAEVANEVAYTCNNEIFSAVNKYKDFIGMATVPLQDVDLAVKELRRVKKELNFNSIEIGSEVNEKNLSDPYFFPFFEEAADNDMFIFIHPLAVGSIPLMEDYDLGPILGHPFCTTAAIANLILSGIFDKIPNLKIGLSHAGGYLPYQLGRLEHGFKVMKKTSKHSKRSPLEYVKENVYFDTITHSKESLELLVKVIGIDNLILGTDYPLYMLEADPVTRIEELGLDQEQRDKVLYKNACQLFKIQ